MGWDSEGCMAELCCGSDVSTSDIVLESLGDKRR